MNSRHIIAQAWDFTRENRRAMWWYAFAPSLLTVLVGVFYLLYQFFAFKLSPLFENAPKSFLSEVMSGTLGFFGAHGGLTFPAIIVAIILGVLYLLLPTLMQGGLIQYIARKRQGHSVKIIEGFSLGLLVFLPLFEYHLLLKTFSLFSLFTEAAFILRNLGTGTMKILLPVFILAGIVALILVLLFTYSEFFIVLDKKPVLRSMGRSSKLVVLGWQHTLLIVILMLLIGLRIIFNIIAVLLVPALIFFSAGFFVTVALAKIGVAIGIVMGLLGLFVASYFTGILHVFSSAVWTFTFLALMEEKKTKEFMGEQG